MDPLQLVVAAGLFSLAGVVIGALLAPLTQQYLESAKEEQAAARAKVLIGGELLHSQLMLRSTVQTGYWPYADDLQAAAVLLPNSMWLESRSHLVGHIDESLYDELVMTYARLEFDRTRMVLANKLPPTTVLPPDGVERLKVHANDVGKVRKRLGTGGASLDELKPGGDKQDQAGTPPPA
jgi:hypothetical protein